MPQRLSPPPSPSTPAQMPEPQTSPEDLLSTPLHGLYIPCALIIFGVAIVDWRYTPYAVLGALVLGAFKVWRGRPKKILDSEKYTQFPLVEKVPVSANTNIYKFALPRSSDKLDLPIGQHITISASIDGKEVTRSYTPISTNDTEGHFELLVKTYPKGNISKHLDKLSLYESIKVRGPKGKMQYKPNMVKKIGMIAGGTGIAPMLQVISAIVREPTDLTEVSLLFANVTEEDILLKEDIDALAEKYPNFKVHYVLNEAPKSGNWNGSLGFVTEDIIKAHLPAPSPDTKIFICGPPPMVSAMKKATLNVGYDKASPVSKAEDQVFVF